MDTNLEQYKIFRVVARCQSFSRAAKELYVSQPAVSQAIANLEESLRTPLFIRGARGVTLTPEGKLLADYVEPALALLETGEEKLTEMAKLLKGEVKIAAADTISRHFLLPYLRSFHEMHPEIHIQVINRTSQQSIDLLKSSAVDLAFANLPINSEGILVEHCMDVHDVFVAGTRFAHLTRQPITPQQLAAQPLIMLEQMSNSRRQVDRHFREYGVELQPEIELCSYDLMLDFAGIGLGIACVIREFAAETMEQNALAEIPLTVPLPPRSIGLCRLQNVPLSFAAGEFYRLIVENRGFF
ncbi:MAG: LysR family transcriptional regulator [Candidatus Merdivicinus sp.]|jgi:DNA-binding transcriptional LysR family regulator